MNLQEQYNMLTEGLMDAGDSNNPKFRKEDANAIQFAIGSLVELEHTDKKEEAEKIALDHLSRVPNYYEKLVKAGLVDEKDALNLYRIHYGN